MRKIYIVLTHTGTILSGIIRKYTKNEYTHASIALDEKLNDIYAFGRLNPYNAFIGGLVKESLTGGTFKRFQKTTTSIYELEVSDFQYQTIETKIKKMFAHRTEYKFNTKGLIAVLINKKIERPKSFYCAEFVRYILGKANIDTSYLPNIIKPEDFKNLKNLKIIYKGRLQEYRLKMQYMEETEKTNKQVQIQLPRRAAV